MKKYICVFVCIVLLLSGCSMTETLSESSEPIKVTLWHYYGGDSAGAFSELVQEFNETAGMEHGILIDAYSYGGVSELADALLDSANEEVGASPMPDIFAAYSDNAFRLDEMGLVASLDSYFTAEELELYRDEFLEEGRFDDEGSLKIIPVAKSTEIVYINATDFEPFANTNGVMVEDVATWEGLVEVAQTYYNWTDDQTEQLHDGKALFGVDSFANFMLVATKQLGGEVFTTEQGGVSLSLTREQALKIWENAYVPTLKGHFAAVGRFRSDDVKFGDLLMYTGSTSGASYFPTTVETDKDAGYDIECLTAPYPVFEGAQNVAVQQGAGMVVARSTPEREAAAVTFLKWFTDTTQNQSFAVSTGYLPVQDSALNLEEVLAELTKSANTATGAAVATANTVYPMIEEYELFAGKPFAGSYDARNVLDASLELASAQRAEILTAVGEGEDMDSLIEQYSSQESFDLWYNDLTSQLQSTMG